MGAAISVRPTAIETLPSFKQLQNAVTNFDSKDSKAADRLSKAIKAFALDAAAPPADKARTLRAFIGNPISLPPSLRDELRRTVVSMSGTSFQIAEARLRAVSALRGEVLEMTDQWNSRIDSLRDSVRGLARAHEQSQLLGAASDTAKRTLSAAASGVMRELRLFRGLLGDIDGKLKDLGAAVKTVLSPLGNIKTPELSQVASGHEQVQSAVDILGKIEQTPLRIGNADDALAVALTDSRRAVRTALELI
jgi:hypothetical protein